MLDALTAAGATHIDARKDYKNSVSSKVVRCVLDGRRAVAVSGQEKAETQIKALLDLLDLHLAGADAGRSVASDEVVVLLQDGTHVDEVKDALATLVAALRGGPAVRLVGFEDDGELLPLALKAPEYDTPTFYAAWPGLLRTSQQAGPPELLEELWEDVDLEALRAYPMLSGFPDWSLRLEGLEIGRVRNGSGWLDVGKAAAGGSSSAARAAWQGATGLAGRYTFGPPHVREATYAIQQFAKDWLPARTSVASARPRQNEHALESRILRGACPVTTPAGDRLQMLEDHYVISWGSQFPTRWARVHRKSARYLDGLLKHGSTPWALEMKIEGGTGVGSYYRHAVGQAVLYRHFIRSALPLHFWFDKYGVDPRLCEAAVVVPDMAARPVWRGRLRGMCDLFDVSLIEVPPGFTELTAG